MKTIAGKIDKPNIPKRKIRSVQTTRQKIVAFGIDAIIECLEEDKSYEDIAKTIGVRRSSVHEWVAADAERSARAKSALEFSADQCDLKAENILKNLPKNGTRAEIAQAKELAEHYRWRARVRNPKRYGDKIELNGSLDVQTRDSQSLETALALTAFLRGVADRAGIDVLPAPEPPLLPLKDKS
jgi:transposase-like protein